MKNGKKITAGGKITIIVAALLLVILGVFNVTNGLIKNNEADAVSEESSAEVNVPDEAESEDTAAEETKTEETSSEETADEYYEDVEACLAYSVALVGDEEYYSYYDIFTENDLTGEKVEAESKFEGYYLEPLYTVNGYDPDFLLCSKLNTGSNYLYFRSTNLDFKNGGELFEGKLHLKERLETVVYESQRSKFTSSMNYYELTSTENLFSEFLDEIYDGEFVSGSVSRSEGLVYHLYLMQNDGMMIYLYINNEGQVCFEGLKNKYIQLSDDMYKRLKTYFNDHTDAVESEINPYENYKAEDCFSDPALGSYMPDCIPDRYELRNCCVVSYIDEETGDAVGTRELEMTYDLIKSLRFIYIEATWVKEYGSNGYGGPIVDIDELSKDIIAEHLRTEDKNGESLDYSDFALAVQYGDVYVYLSGDGLTVDEAYDIFMSIK